MFHSPWPSLSKSDELSSFLPILRIFSRNMYIYYIHIRHTDIATRNFYSTLFCNAGLIVSELRLWDRTRDRTKSRCPTEHWRLSQLSHKDINKIDVSQPMAIVVKVSWTSSFLPILRIFSRNMYIYVYTYQAHRYSNEKFLQYAIL